MDFGPTFIIAVLAISTFGWVLTSWIRARHGYPLDNWGKTARSGGCLEAASAECLEQENEALRGRLKQLEQRLEVLERIATDQPARLTREIEQLR